MRAVSRVVAFALTIAPLLSGAPPLHAQPASPAAAALRTAVDHYRRAHEIEILREFRDLLAIPNLAGDSANIRRNAAAVTASRSRNSRRISISCARR